MQATWELLKNILEAQNKSILKIKKKKNGKESVPKESQHGLAAEFQRPETEKRVLSKGESLVLMRKIRKSINSRTTKMISGMGGLPYEGKLKKLEPFSLEKKHLRWDIIMIYKILNGKGKINKDF